MDHLTAQLSVIDRRIDRALDNRDPKAFHIAAQLRAAVLRQQAAAPAPAAVEAAT